MSRPPGIASRGVALEDVARVGALLAFASLVYWPSLGVPFAFDDIPNLVLNPRVQPETPGDLVAALDARAGRDDRPLAMLSFALNYLWGGLDPTSYHVVNLVVHALNAALLYALLKALASAPRSPEALAGRAAAFAFAGALLWVVHPVNTQAVTYIVQRMASLAATFYLAALLLFVAWRSGRVATRRAWIGIGLAFAAGMATKPHVVTLPAALVLVDLAFYRFASRAHAVALVVIAAGAGAIGAWLATADPFAHLTSALPGGHFSGLERLMTQGRVLWHYLSLLAWPDAGRLQVDYDFTVSRSLLDPPVTALAWAGLLAVTVAAVAGLRRLVWPAFGWLFFALALSVESGIVLLELAFEHRLYLPSALLLPGLLAPVFVALSHAGRPTVASLAALAIAAALCVQTLERNAAWRDLGGLWRQDLARGATPFRAALNGAIGLARQGRPAEALALIDAAPASAETSEAARLLQMRGEILVMLGRHEEALDAFRDALAIYPGWTRAAYSAGQSLIALGRVDAAGDLARQLAEVNPDGVFAAVLRAEVAHARGDPEAAARVLRGFLARGGHSVDVRSIARLHLAHVLRALGRSADAAQRYREIVREDPKHWAAWANLYHMLEASGDLEQAERVRRYLDQHNVDPAAWRVGRTGPTAPPQAADVRAR